MKRKAITFVFLMLFSVCIISMNISVQGMDVSVECPIIIDVWTIVFDSLDIMARRNLALVSKPIYTMACDRYFKKEDLTIEHFIDDLYATCHANDNKLFSWLVEKHGQYKNRVLINYYKRWHQYDSLDQEFKNNLCENQFGQYLKIIINKFDKKHVKFFVPASKVLLCDYELKGYDRKIKSDNHSKADYFKQVINECVDTKQIGKDIVIFFDKYENEKSIDEHFEDCYQKIRDAHNQDIEEYIKKALDKNNFSVLVLLCDHIFNKKDNGLKEKLKNYFFNATTHDHRRMLAQTKEFNLYYLVNKAMGSSKEKDKALSIFRIIFEQGNALGTYFCVNKGFLSNIFKNNLAKEVLPKLFEIGVYFNLENPESMQSNQIREFVEAGHNVLGKNFWSTLNSYNLLLHRAVQLQDLSLVKYLLSIGANPNIVDCYKKTPILYSLNNDDVFNLLVNQEKSQTNNRGPHELFFAPTRSYEFVDTNKVKDFINDSNHFNLIKFVENGFVENYASGWIYCAIELDKLDLFKSLLKKASNISDYQKNCFLREVLCSSKKEMFNHLLDQVTAIDSAEIAQKSLKDIDSEMTIALLEKGFDISMIKDEKDLIDLLEKVEELKLLECLNGVKIIKDKSHLLRCAVLSGKWEIVNYLSSLPDSDNDITVKNNTGQSAQTMQTIQQEEETSHKDNESESVLKIGQSAQTTQTIQQKKETSHEKRNEWVRSWWIFKPFHLLISLVSNIFSLLGFA